jgi:hypothetical protein
MAVQTPLAPDDQQVEAGVIEDARRRQRRHRLAGIVLVAGVIAAGAVLGFAGGAGGDGGKHGRSAHGDGVPPYVSHTVIKAPSAALLRDAVRECDGPRFSHYGRGSNPPGTFAGPLAFAAGTTRFVGLIAVTQRSISLCAVRVPRLTPYGPGFQSHGDRKNPGLKAATANKLRTDGLVTSGGMEGSETWAYGRAGRDVTAVTFVLNGRRAVSAEVKNGWYMAWWPGTVSTQTTISVRVTTKAGTVSSPLPGKQCREKARSCEFDLPG